MLLNRCPFGEDGLNVTVQGTMRFNGVYVYEEDFQKRTVRRDHRY